MSPTAACAPHKEMFAITTEDPHPGNECGPPTSGSGDRRRGRRHDLRVTPDHPGLPARVSELMLPARGWVARFVEPHESSTLTGRTAEALTPRILLSGRPRRRLRSFFTLAPR